MSFSADPNYGELGDGTKTDITTPTQIGTASNWKAVSTRSRHVLALRTNGTLWAWGINDHGQLGVGTNVEQLIPVQIGTDTDWVDISTGTLHSLALKANGTLWTWGDNAYRQLGTGEKSVVDTNFPVQIGTDSDWKSVHATSLGSFAIKKDGTLWGWGNNTWGQLGDGTKMNGLVPRQIGTDSDWLSVAPIGADRYHNIAIKIDGSMWSWGYNREGMLGNGVHAETYRNIPTRIGTGNDWRSVVVGDKYSLAIKDDGSMYEWGDIDFINITGSIGRYYVVPTYISPPNGLAYQIFPLCSVPNISDLYASGSNIRWYTSPTGGEPLSPSMSVQHATRYYASQQIGSCESEQRLHAVVWIEQVPIPSSSTFEQVCEGATLADVSIVGQGIKWYLTTEGGSSVLPSLTSITSGTHYYVSQTINGCESPRKDVLVTFGIPAVPTGETTQRFCSSATISNLRAFGTNVKWYTSPTGGVPLSWWRVLQTNTHYYAGQKINNCESETRLDVLVEVSMIDAPTGSDSQTFCKGSTLKDLIATGTEIRWYTAAFGGASLDLSTVIADGTYYYASQTIDGCESTHRLKVNTILHDTPAPVTDFVEQTFCHTSMISEIHADGNAIKYYAKPQGGTPLPADQLVSDETFYYLTQTLNGCESQNRLTVKARITKTPSPEASVVQQFCNSANVGQLSASGEDLKWYNKAEGGDHLDTDTQLINDSRYYVSQTINGCESDSRKEVTVQILSPDNPFGEAIQHLCEGATLEDIVISGSEIQWYENYQSETPLPISTILQNAKSYFASQSMSGCESNEWSEIKVIITATPAPTGNALQSMDIGKTIFDLVVQGSGIKWYSSIEDAVNSINPLDPDKLLEDQVTYYCTQSIEGCRGTASLAVTVSLLPEHITSVGNEPHSSGILVEKIGNLLFINVKNGRVVEIYDVLGRTIPFQRSNENSTVLQKPRGVFFIRYESGGRVFIKKLLS